MVATSFGVSQSGSQAGEKKGGYVHYEVEPGFTIRMRHDIDPTTDPKKLKRLHNFHLFLIHIIKGNSN